MNYLSICTINVNSLLRANSKKQTEAPYLLFMRKTQDILLMADTRISPQKFEFLSDKLSLSNQINVKKKRFFSSLAEGSKTGGCSIYIPQSYDNVLNVIYEKADTAEIPRFISLICSIVGGPSLLLTCFYGCPGKTSEKAKVFRRLYAHLYDITNRFGISIIIMGGDFNQQLDKISENNEDKRTFQKIISDFLLTDAFCSCPRETSKKDISRLAKQDQLAFTNENGFTYYPKIIGNKRSRIDGIFFSSCLEHTLIEKSFCLSRPHPYSDHCSTHFSFAWNLAGIPAGNVKPSYHFHNSLLEDKKFVQIIKKDIADTILEFYTKMGGWLDRAITDGLALNCLESILFDRLKNDSIEIPAIDIFYEMLSKIEKSQNCYLKKRTCKEKEHEQKLVQEISRLEKIRNPKRSEQRMLKASSLELSDLQKRKVKRQAIDASIDYQTLGEFGSKYFLRSKVARRNKSFVRVFEKSDGELIYDSHEIEQQFYDHFKKILETPDPFCKEAFYRFINPIRDKFGSIKETDKVAFNECISVQEVCLAVKKVKSNSAPGIDGCTGRLLTLIHSLCPRLICHAINNQILTGYCVNKQIMIKRLIFIPKPGVNKKSIKKFRPISLLNSILKLADTCVVNRLVASLENGKILPPYMFAYRSGFSTTDAIISLQTFIDNANHTGRKLVILSWDVSSAFDKISRLLVLECLKMLGCSDFLIESFKKMPTGAIARICINLAESRFPGIPAPHACPQGLGSSAQLFGIGMYCLLLKLNNENVSSYKIDLCIRKDISPVEAFTELQWRNEGRSGLIDNNFKKTAREQWNLLTREDKKIIKASFTKKFHDQATMKISEIASTICYSDDGHLFLDYTKIEDILNVMDIFYQFGSFSGLKINPDKTKLITLNFTLSTEEIECLSVKGFDPNMICDGNQYFRFLGCDIKPYLLKDGAIQRLNQLCDDMQDIALAFNNNCTLKGRRLVCESLMISKLQSALTAFDLNEKDICRIQKIIDSFVHRKKISAGKRKYLSFNRAGIQIPKYFEKYLVARVCVLKSLFTKIADNKTIPMWGQILIKALRFIGFSSPTLLFKSFGQADIRFIIKHLNELGFHALAGLFKSAEIINNIFERRRSGQNRKKRDITPSDIPNDLICLNYRIDFNGQIASKKTVCYKDKFGRYRDYPDPPKFRSISMIGCLDDPMLIARNKQTLFTVWKDLQPECRIPAFEFSARNAKDMSLWIVNYAASSNVLLDTENQISPNKRILPIIQKSERHAHIFEALADRAKQFCIHWAAAVGPSSPIHQPNTFTGWISSRTIGNNGKSLYYQLLEAKYEHEKSTAIQKFEKIGISGKIDNIRIGRGLARGVKTFNSAKTQRASVELSLCAMRCAKDIARINDNQAKPCYCCGVYENEQNLPTGGIYSHQFLDCAPATFLIQYMKILSIQVLGFPLEINLNLILFNEMPHKKCKDIDENAKKIYFCLLNCYKATIYGLYYSRPSYITSDFLLYKLNQNIRIACNIAKERGSQLMKKIKLPSSHCRSLLSFHKIRSNVIDETRHLRRNDNEIRRRLYISQNINNSDQLNANIPRPRNINKIQTPSSPKRQILIQEAFARIKNKKYTKNGDLELVE